MTVESATLLRKKQIEGMNLALRTHYVLSEVVLALGVAAELQQREASMLKVSVFVLVLLVFGLAS